MSSLKIVFRSKLGERIKEKNKIVQHPRRDSNPDSSDDSARKKLGVRCLSPLGHAGIHLFIYSLNIFLGFIHMHKSIDKWKWNKSNNIDESQVWFEKKKNKNIENSFVSSSDENATFPMEFRRIRWIIKRNSSLVISLLDESMEIKRSVPNRKNFRKYFLNYSK